MRLSCDVEEQDNDETKTTYLAKHRLARKPVPWAGVVTGCRARLAEDGTTAEEAAAIGLGRGLAA